MPFDPHSWPFTYGSSGWASWANNAERQKARTRLEKEREAASKREEAANSASLKLEKKLIER